MPTEAIRMERKLQQAIKIVAEPLSNGMVAVYAYFRNEETGIVFIGQDEGL